jgi:leucine dehydrogenase
LDDGLFELIGEHGHEQLSLWSEPKTGYRGVVAIHNTILGPALGGTRMWAYENDLEALIDVLRLSRGRHVQSMCGRYITAEDVGTSPSDMEFVREETEYVVGLAGRSGDPSPVTALGVYRGMQACAKTRWGSDSLSGKTVTVQGVGHVGYHLCKHMHDEGALLVVTDIEDDRIKRVVDEFGATAVGPDEIYGVEADIFAPCALGAIINDDTLQVLKVEIVAGAANNVLDEERHGDVLHERGILYAPDYAVNAGGLINVNAEVEGWDLERSHKKASEIYDTILKIVQIADDQGIPTYRAADRLAEDRIAEATARKKKRK